METLKDSKGRDVTKPSIKIYYKKIFHHLIDEATYNYFVLYQKDGGKDLLLWTRDKEEVEVVDLVLRLKDKLVSGEKGSLPVTPQTMAKLRRHVQAIVSGLPEDLQQVLASSR
ncbi:hypothetical protein HPB52_010486 [Rhipicephalus sanguineus]|uniref:Uncharacterized protein n=1 Tax=Rhipicephalus sanguineus TaxID=34632 RepID=A0A9D4SSC5_RHISA|nr:hypothetical protein HPB52_010486 [Rhipicephalus sanguineus]